MTMDVVLQSPVFKSDILESNGKIEPRIEFKPYLNGYKSQSHHHKPKTQSTGTPGFSLNPACTCLLMFDSLIRVTWIAFRTVFVTINNLYCIPTYAVWMFLLLPVKFIHPNFYWHIEGRLFHWLLAMVSLWSYSAGYQIVESGSNIDPVVEDEILVMANHQSTSDVPLLMAAFNTRRGLLPNLTWIMDRIFKYTNFGVVSAIHGDFFIVAGKDARDRSIFELTNYLKDIYTPRKRKWIVLFPEGGFLHKRRSISQRYAEKNKLPRLHHVTIPRMGAVQAIVDTIGPRTFPKEAGDAGCFEDSPGKLKYILDITIAYPEGKPLDILAVVSGYIKPCEVHIHYRLFCMKKIPITPENFQDWLFKIYEEKEMMLASYYETGEWNPMVDPNMADMEVDVNDLHDPTEPKIVRQDLVRMALLHSFFILSSFLHWTLFCNIYSSFMTN